MGDDSVFDRNSRELAAIPAADDDPGMQPNLDELRRDVEDPNPPPANVGAGSSSRQQGANLNSGEEFDEEDEESVPDKLPQTVKNGTERKLADGDDEENKKKKKKLATLLGVCFFFIILIILLILFFKPDEGARARTQIDDTLAPSKAPTYFPTESTEAPTLSPIQDSNPTQVPTKLDDTPAPTRKPSTPFPTTTSPTLFPTVEVTQDPGDGLVSRLPCDEIRVQPNVTEGIYGENNFKFYPVGDKEVCGDTFGGKDPEKPQRSHWSVRYGRRDCPALNYAEGFELCDKVGARWCSLDEYLNKVALGTGCGGDRQYVWTNTRCTANGQSGRQMFDLGLRDPKQPYHRCEPDLNTLSPIRCCGDNF